MRILRTLLVAALVVLAGCGGTVAPDSTAGGTDAPTAQTDGTTTAATDGSTTEQTEMQQDDGQPDDSGSGDEDGAVSGSNAKTGGTVNFYVSDEQNDIDDFEHLNVTITRVGLQGGANESEGWTEYDVEEKTYDLTELQGPKATFMDSIDVDNGTYQKVFVYVSEVNGTLDGGDHQTVKLPSGKLHLTKPFTVGTGENVSFVFDITVHETGNGGKYILKPVVGESGTDVPMDPVDDENEDEEEQSDLAATFLGNVTPGENATVEVTRNGSLVEGANVTVENVTADGADVFVNGTTDANGTVEFGVPENATEIRVLVTDGDEAVVIERTFDGTTTESTTDNGSQKRSNGASDNGNAPSTAT